MSNQQQMQQQAQQQQRGGQPSAPQNVVGPTNILPQLAPQHLLAGLMAANPAFAAAPLFHPSSMMTNPAFLGMQQPGEAFGLLGATQQGVARQQMAVPGFNAVVNQMQTIAPAMGAPFAPSMSFAPLAPAPPAATTENNMYSTTESTRTLVTSQEKAKQNRDRNREHAKSTRLRKKAYVQKLKELVEGLHAERTEEVRQRRVAIQHLAEMQNVRRCVVRTFLRYHSKSEADERKWSTILDESFWLKQPVTPYRSFQQAEIEKECRISRGFDAITCDAASMAVMIESIGHKSSRWMQLKREEFLYLEEAKRGSRKMPKCIIRQESRLSHAVSSLSNSDSSGDDKTASLKTMMMKAQQQHPPEGTTVGPETAATSSNSDGHNKISSSRDFHDYHAKPLPDPKLRDSDQSGDDSPEDEESEGKRRMDSSGEEETPVVTKRRKIEERNSETLSTRSHLSSSSLPPNVARKGGIAHNIVPSDLGNGAARLRAAPAVALPPFSGIGKRHPAPAPVLSSTVVPALVHSHATIKNDVMMMKPPIGTSVAAPSSTSPALIVAEFDTSSSEDDSKTPQIQGDYHINEDDMILLEDVLMCPFVFRTQDAVVCGAFSECVMPGMMRAHFSSRNKLLSMELVYDAMGFMQQLERASGNEGTAQIVAGSLEMALAPCSTEARVITQAKAPFLIVSVNEVWTRMTGCTQMEVEGREYLALLEGEGTIPEAKTRKGRPPHVLDQVAKGRSACSTNIHYDSDGRDFVNFVCSYPLTNASNEITHLLHVSKELPSFQVELLHRQSA